MLVYQRVAKHQRWDLATSPQVKILLEPIELYEQKALTNLGEPSLHRKPGFQGTSLWICLMGLFPLHPQNGSFHVFSCVLNMNTYYVFSFLGSLRIFPQRVGTCIQQPISPRLGLFEPVDETREPQLGPHLTGPAGSIEFDVPARNQKIPSGCSGTNPENMFCWVAITTPYDSSIENFCKVMCWLDRMGCPGFPMDCDHPSFILDNKTWLVAEPYPSEKWWSSSVRMMTFPICWESHKSHVPNHQPETQCF